MSNTIILLEHVTKQYKQFRHPGWRAWEALGGPVSSKRYEVLTALNNINVHIRAGERVALIGRNGAGKSTLLRIITKQIRPTQGRVQITKDVQALLELGTGFYPDFTGRENIVSSLAYRGIAGRAVRSIVEDVVAFSELENFIDRPVREYSAGMYARLAFALATSVTPEILIIDEILGAGDAYFIGKSLKRMKALTEKGATVLFVSHDLSAAQLLCERALWLDHGCLQADGDMLSVSKQYVRSIRAKEEQHAREAGGVIGDDLQPLKPHDRYGEGPVQITGFAFFDREGERRHTLITGQYAKAVFAYRAEEAINDPNIVIAIYRPDGICVMQVISAIAGQAFDCLMGKGSITVTFDPLYLGPGEYRVSVAIFKTLNVASNIEPQAYDLHDRCYALKILPPEGVHVELGLVNQPSRWELA